MFVKYWFIKRMEEGECCHPGMAMTKGCDNVYQVSHDSSWIKLKQQQQQQ